MYACLWKAAGLQPNAELEWMEAVHDKDEARGYEEQLRFVESWTALSARLWDARFKRTPVERELVFTSSVEGFRSTSYRCYVLHQCSVLARRVLLDAAKAHPGRWGYIKTPAPPDETLARVLRTIRCVHHALEAQEKARNQPILDSEGLWHYERMVWVLRDRHGSLRVLASWLTGLKYPAEALRFWKRGQAVAARCDEQQMEGVARNPEELQFDDLVRKSMAVHSALKSVAKFPCTDSSRALLRYLRIGLGCNDIELADDCRDRDWDDAVSRVWLLPPDDPPAFVTGGYDQHPQERAEATRRITQP